MQNLIKQIEARIKIAREKIAAAKDLAEASRWEGRILAYHEIIKLIQDLGGGQ